MLLIRRFEERAARAYTEAKIGGYCHLNLGEEATVVGLMTALRPDDYLFTNYRDHGYAIAKGIGADRVMAELYGRSTGVSKGWGGSMHLFDAEKRMLGGYGIVGGQLPLATGAALAVSYKGGDEIVMCQMGDGTAAIGAFHESLNIAALWDLPIVFVVINNGLGMGTTVDKSSAEPELYKRGAAYRMESARVDGADVVAVRDAARAAVERARSQSKPYLLETVSPRPKGHSVVDPARYRTKEEKDALKAADPLAKMALDLEEAGFLSHEDRDRLDAEVTAEVDEAAKFADESPEPRSPRCSTTPTPPRSRATSAGSPPTPYSVPERHPHGNRDLPPGLRDTLRVEMLRDENILLLGEEIGLFEGSYKITEGC